MCARRDAGNNPEAARASVKDRTITKRFLIAVALITALDGIASSASAQNNTVADAAIARQASHSCCLMFLESPG
jgi:hypothetical protein